MMGTFIYAINADTGEIIWKNEGTSSNFILQPHRYPAFADVAPQGNFTITGDKLLVAGGRSVPAAFDLKTGEELYYQLGASGKTGGAFTCSNDNVFFNHHRERMTIMYDSKTGDKLKSDAGEYPVIDGNNIYFSGRKITASIIYKDNRIVSSWKSDFSATNDLIKAGDCLYAADSAGITAIKIVDNVPQKLWSQPSENIIERLIASNGKLITVTSDGSIQVYGDTPVEFSSSVKKQGNTINAKSSIADNIIEKTGIKEGYAVIYGTKDVELLKNLILKTSLRIIAFEKDEKRIAELREYFDNEGVTAENLAFHPFGITPLQLPKYFASLTVVSDPGYLNDPDFLNQMYESARPFDGKIWINKSAGKQRKIIKSFKRLDLYGAELLSQKESTIISRTGPLKGSADWTHNYGNISNTVKSNDELVQAPLGILWFGGNSNMDVLPRHGHGPGEQIVDGRLIIQGINSISARDVYTGRVLWKKEFENLKSDTWMVYYDETYDEENPLDPKYNQVHIPGANARGTNFIATKEYVYVIEGPVCRLLDIRTGDLVKTISLGDDYTQDLGYIGVYENLLILGNNFSNYPEIILEGEKPAKEKSTDFDLTASRELVILDRFSGEKKWSIKANHGFIHNSVIAGDGMLFCLDKLPQYLETKLKRRGENQPEGSRLLCLNINSGEKLFEETNNIFGTWLGYSSEHKLLLQATRPSSDMLTGEDGKRMMVYKIPTKEIIWDKAISYSNPPIISNDKIYTESEGFSLLTGEPLYEKDLLTGEDVKWYFNRTKGCGYVVASEHLLTFRSSSAAFVNLDVFEGVGSLGGFKPGCSANLIVAGGVLNSPDYTRTCQCPFQNQTSLALIFMPWVNYWTTSDYKWNGKQIKQLGLNLNAPGDRISKDNILWLEFPNVGGLAPEIPIKIDTVNYFKIRKEPISVLSENTPWISSSAIGGIRSIEITLSKEQVVPDVTYKIKLYFSELENKKKDDRIFDISIQGKKVLENFDIFSEAGGENKEIVKTFNGITAGTTLTIGMNPKKGNTIISGIELIQESKPENLASAK